MTTSNLSRRQFLQSSAAVAGATLPLYSTLAVNSAPKKIRMGVVGGGALMLGGLWLRSI